MPIPLTSIRPQEERAFDLVLWGATGFTGALVAEELVRRYGARSANGASPLTWALGGRNRAKLEALRDRLCAVDARAKDLPIVVADARDESSLATMVRDARVIATTVGPYAIHGHELAASCAEQGTSYCDLTGEPHFVRASIDRNHARARETGARIVHACGFDSIPSDLGVWMVQDHAKANGTHASRIDMLVARMKGGASGGTAATMLHIAEATRTDPALRRLLGNVYALDPDPTRRGSDHSDLRSVRHDREHDVWTGPFFMAFMNTRIVRRTHALLGYGWGEGFRYSEVMSFGAGPRGLVRAATMTAGLGAFFGAMSVPALRKLLAEHVLPAPGEGPNAEARARGHFKFEHHARLGDGSRVVGVVSDSFDPGYGSTARMFSEAAVCLAQDPLESEPGVVTPAFAMRHHFIARARAIGITFQLKQPLVSQESG